MHAALGCRMLLEFLQNVCQLPSDLQMLPMIVMLTSPPPSMAVSPECLLHGDIHVSFGLFATVDAQHAKRERVAWMH